MAYVQFFSVRPVHGFSDAQDPDAAPSTALYYKKNYTAMWTVNEFPCIALQCSTVLFHTGRQLASLRWDSRSTAHAQPEFWTPVKEITYT